MRNFVKLAAGLNITPLLQQLERHRASVDFVDLSIAVGHDPLHPGYSHREAHAIVVRYVDIPDDIASNAKAYKETSDNLFAKPRIAWYALSSLRQLVYQLFEAVDGVHIGGIGIMKVPAGSRIYPHYDTGLATEFYHRYHIVLEGPPGCWFICGEGDDEERVEQLTGEAWWFNSRKKHAVVNDNPVDSRISISIDIAS